MGGRGSGGGRSGGGAAKKVPTGEGITDKNELINLYNSISGNSNLSVEQRVKAMHDIQERIKELDAKKASDLKQKRLDALAKARAKRAENKKNGIKVIPTVSWSDESSYKYAFLGIPKHSVVAIGTVGVLNDKNAITLFMQGFKEMLKQLEPKEILIYGNKLSELDGYKNLRWFEPYMNKFKKARS